MVISLKGEYKYVHDSGGTIYHENNNTHKLILSATTFTNGGVYPTITNGNLMSASDTTLVNSSGRINILRSNTAYTYDINDKCIKNETIVIKSGNTINTVVPNIKIDLSGNTVKSGTTTTTIVTTGNTTDLTGGTTYSYGNKTIKYNSAVVDINNIHNNKIIFSGVTPYTITKEDRLITVAKDSTIILSKNTDRGTVTGKTSDYAIEEHSTAKISISGEVRNNCNYFYKDRNNDEFTYKLNSKANGENLYSINGVISKDNNYSISSLEIKTKESSDSLAHKYIWDKSTSSITENDIVLTNENNEKRFYYVKGGKI